MSSFANISIRFSNNLKQFSSQMANASRDMKKMGKQMQRTGKNMSTYLTAPILALGYVSVEAFDKQAKAIAQVEAGVKSTGQAAGFATEELLKMASDLQNKTIFGDEEILQGATAQLLTFTNIAGEQFERTQLAALNLSTRLDGDLKSASIQLGKALNDPIANLSALSRSGIQFSEDQKAVIKSLADSGRLADAQTIILDELEKQYGGAAEAAAKAGKGGLTQLYNILGDLMESFGEIVMEYINPFVAKLKALALRFNDLDKSTKKIIVVIAAFAAAIGPILVTLGFLMTTVIPGLITLLPTLGTAFTALTGPIGLVVAAIAAIAYMVYKHWDRVKQEMVKLQNYFIDLYNESVVFRVAVEYIIFTFKALWAQVKFVFNAIWTVVKNVAKYIVDSFKNVGAGIKAALTGDLSGITKAYKDQSKLMGQAFGDTIKDLGDNFQEFTGEIKTNFSDAVDAVTKRKKIAFVKSNIDATAITEKVKEAVDKGLTPTGTGGRAKVQSVNELTPQEAVQMVSPLDSLQATLPSQTSFIDEQMLKVQERMIKLQEIGAIVGTELNATFQDFTAGFVESLGLANDGFQGFIKGMIQTVTKLISMMLAQSISQAIAGATAAGASTGPAAIFTTPSFIATAVGGVLSAFAAIPKFADGGLVYGPTLGLMGEYSGARNNPEVIAPLDKLKKYIGESGGGNVKVEGEFKLRNNVLVAAVKKGEQYNSRRGN